MMQTDIKVKVLPRSSRDQILGMEDGVLRVKVTTPPVEGKANNSLISLLSKGLDIPKSHIAIISGKGSRVKLVRFHGMSLEDIHLKIRRGSDR